MQSERVRNPPLLEPLRSLPLVLTCLFVAVAAVDALVALQPGLLGALRSRWQQAVPIGSSPWATLLAAAVIVGGVALTATMLASFIRSVRAAPYVCLAPLWVGSCMLVIGRLPFELPLPVPAPAFIASCALVFVGGGVLFERRAALWNALGALLCLLPPALLALGYGLAPEARFDGNAALMLAVVVLAAAGAPIIAIASRVHGPRVGPLTADDMIEQEALARQEVFDSQIAELAARVRETEERAVRAERQLAVQPAWQPDVVPRLALHQDELTPALIVRRTAYPWLAPTLLVLCALGAAGGYLFAYLPLQAELTSQQQQNALQAEAQSDAIAAVRTGYDRERRALEQQLTEAKAALAIQAAPQPQAEPAPVASPEEERRAARIAKREAAIAARDARAAEQQAAREQRAAEQQAAREQRTEEQQAAREQRTAEQQAAREKRAADQQAAREQHAAEYQATREQRTAEQQAAREQRAAERKARAASAASDQAPPAPEAAKPAQPAAPRDALDAENDDPLEGL